jgi:hypothetical protein
MILPAKRLDPERAMISIDAEILEVFGMSSAIRIMTILPHESSMMTLSALY